MRLVECFLTANDCYKTAQTIKPKGVMVHSTGANNKSVKRYVNPLKTDPDYSGLISLIGGNLYGNHWNKSGTGKCVHAFIGTLADGSIGTVQTLPWNHRGWHAGSGSKGSANNTHISFEICEDGLTDKAYFEKVYKEAVELTAMLCERYALDPLADGVVICHKEGKRRGVASDHMDVEHWFPRFGKTMDDFRKDVARELEEDEMTQEQFNKMMDAYLAEREQTPPASWSAEARRWAEGVGLIKGDAKGNKMYNAWVTREQLMQFMHRLHK